MKAHLVEFGGVKSSHLKDSTVVYDGEGLEWSDGLPQAKLRSTLVWWVTRGAGHAWLGGRHPTFAPCVGDV